MVGCCCSRVVVCRWADSQLLLIEHYYVNASSFFFFRFHFSLTACVTFTVRHRLFHKRYKLVSMCQPHCVLNIVRFQSLGGPITVELDQILIKFIKLIEYIFDMSKTFPNWGFELYLLASDGIQVSCIPFNSKCPVCMFSFFVKGCLPCGLLILHYHPMIFCDCWLSFQGTHNIP